MIVHIVTERSRQQRCEISRYIKLCSEGIWYISYSWWKCCMCRLEYCRDLKCGRQRESGEGCSTEAGGGKVEKGRRRERSRSKLGIVVLWEWRVGPEGWAFIYPVWTRMRGHETGDGGGPEPPGSDVRGETWGRRTGAAICQHTAGLTHSDAASPLLVLYSTYVFSKTLNKHHWIKV